LRRREDLGPHRASAIPRRAAGGAGGKVWDSESTPKRTLSFRVPAPHIFALNDISSRLPLESVPKSWTTKVLLQVYTRV